MNIDRNRLNGDIVKCLVDGNDPDRLQKLQELAVLVDLMYEYEEEDESWRDEPFIL